VEPRPRVPFRWRCVLRFWTGRGEEADLKIVAVGFAAALAQCAPIPRGFRVANLCIAAAAGLASAAVRPTAMGWPKHSAE
jgi:hypothetical protein